MKYKLSNKTNQLLNESEILLRKANLNDLDNILELYKERIKWFKDEKIDQWTHYLDYTPIYDFEHAIKNNQFFILINNNKIISAFELSTHNKYFEDDSKDAYYIYKIVTKVGYKKIGNIIFSISKDIAISNNKKYIRLDCLTRNKKLNDIYEKHGFKLKKETSIGNYNCSLRELKIKE